MENLLNSNENFFDRKRMTTVRSFAIVRNWVVQQNEQLNEVSNQRNKNSDQS